MRHVISVRYSTEMAHRLPYPARMKSRRTGPKRSERIPKSIAPNPWRRGRRRSGVHGDAAGNDGAVNAGVDSRAGAGSHGGPNGGQGDRGNDGGSAPPVTSAVRLPGARPLGQVIGLFADRASAELACRSLAERGYREDAIKLLISDQTCAHQFPDFVTGRVDTPTLKRREGNGYAGDVLASRQRSAFSHRPRPCPAMVDVAVCSDPESPVGVHASGSLEQALAGSGVAHDRVSEYASALRDGAVLLLVMTRSPDDARLIEIEWRRSYRAEKVHS